jgi:hypothetical protein
MEDQAGAAMLNIRDYKDKEPAVLARAISGMLTPRHKASTIRIGQLATWRLPAPKESFGAGVRHSLAVFFR